MAPDSAFCVFFEPMGGVILLFLDVYKRQILDSRKIRWQQLTDVHELELYFTAYWRLFQFIDDRMQTGIQNAMFWELKVAIRVMDEFISYMIGISQQGNSCFDMMRLNFMMTAALLRNSLAAKMTNTGLPLSLIHI